MQDWSFVPAEGSDGPIVRTVDITLRFRADGQLLVERQGHIPSLDVEGLAYQPTPLRELDTPPRVQQATQPAYLEEWAQQGITGSVSLYFYIDEQGNARVPIVQSASDPLLASIAVEAVKQWNFAPAQVDGEPVLIRVQQDFDFGSSASASVEQGQSDKSIPQ